MAIVPRSRVAWGPAAVGVAVAIVAVVRLSDAALSSAGPPGVDASAMWVDGELTVADEPVGAGLFDVEMMLPGRPEVRCLTVRYAGEAGAASMRLYATGVTGGLAPFLDVLVEVGQRCVPFTSRSVVFAGTLAEMPATWGAAAPAWAPVPGERLAYRFSVTLRDDRRALDLEAGAELLWEARPPPARGGAP